MLPIATPTAPPSVSAVESSAPVIELPRVSFAAGPVALPDVAALTDSRGAFTLSAPAPGTYTVHCMADGYAPGSRQVAVRSGERVEIQCRLER